MISQLSIFSTGICGSIRKADWTAAEKDRRAPISTATLTIAITDSPTAQPTKHATNWQFGQFTGCSSTGETWFDSQLSFEMA